MSVFKVLLRIAYMNSKYWFQVFPFSELLNGLFYAVFLPCLKPFLTFILMSFKVFSEYYFRIKGEDKK